MFTSLLLALSLLLAPSVNLTVSPTSGVAPLEVTVTVTIPESFDGQACVVVTRDDQPVAHPFCQDAAPTIQFPLTGPQVGTFQFQAFLVDEDQEPIAESNLVTVTVK
jgi:hypothetical protein